MKILIYDCIVFGKTIISSIYTNIIIRWKSYLIVFFIEDIIIAFLYLFRDVLLVENLIKIYNLQYI